MEEQRNIVITQLIWVIVERQAKIVETQSMLRMLSMIVMARNLKVAELSRMLEELQRYFLQLLLQEYQ